MHRIVVAIAATLVTMLSSAVHADANRGAQYTASCAHCHGIEGNSSADQYPNIASQQKEYLYRQLKAFKEGTRKDPMMSPMVGVLDDQAMRDVADFYFSKDSAKQKTVPDPAKAAAGKKIAVERICATCHLPTYKGQNEFPKLTRQKLPYLAKQLTAFRDGTRANDGGVMAASVKGLTDAEIEALAHFLSSL
ncbi:MAG: c-type cytochrome [Burkholderiales bacterium]